LNSVKKESSTSFNPIPTRQSASESAVQANDPDVKNSVVNSIADVTGIDAVGAVKPADSASRRRKPKPRTPTVILPARRPAARLPAGCRRPELWRRISAHTDGSALRRRRSAKLPAVQRTQPQWRTAASIVIHHPGELPIQASNITMQIKPIVEAILFAANKPMTIKQIQQVFPELEQPDTLEIQEAIEAIGQDYLLRPIGLKRVASGYRFQVREGMAYWVSRIFEEKPQRYSRAALETLAIIAYRQPVTRGEIEDIRGVSISSGIIQSLLEREWIREIGHKEVPGRPALLGTTKQFLDYFNLSSVTELPTIEELAKLDLSLTPPQQSQDTSERLQTELLPANDG
jgi:segregation and condensation protein B